jgi:hypothetical protein
MYNEKKSKIASQLIDYESPIKLSSEWERLEKRLRKEKRRRAILILIPIAIGVFVASMLIFDGFIQDAEPITETNPVKIGQTNNENSNITTASINRKSLASINEKSYSNNLDQNTYNSKQSNNNINQSPSLLNQIKHQASETTTIGQTSTSNLNNKKTSLDDIYPNSDTPIGNNGSTTYNKSESISSEINASDFHTTNFINPYNESNNRFENGPIYINTIATLSPNLLYDKNEVPSILIKPIIHKQQNKIWIDIAMGIGKPIIDYTDVYSESEQLVALKKKAEKPLENIQCSASLAKHIHQGFYIKSSLQYSRMNDVINTSIVDTSISLIPNSIIGVYTNHEGLTQNSYGTLKKISISEKEITKYGNTQSLSIAMLIGKNFEIAKSKWCIEVGAGRPIWTTYKGQALKGFNLSQPKSDIFTTNNRWSMISSLYHQYPLSKFLYLSGGYTFTYHKLSTNLDYSNTIKVHSFSIGLRYFIN